MHIDPAIVLGSVVVGLLVGTTGAGGGALMTPMLVLLFGIKAPTAISSDLVAAVVLRPVGAAVHFRRGTVRLSLVGWVVLGAVPMAFLGAYLLHLVDRTGHGETAIEVALGAALLVGAAAMAARSFLDRRGGRVRSGEVRDVAVRPMATVMIGMVGGIMVGMTSVGSGSLMIVLLLCAYPSIGAGQLVGTDLAQAVPLTMAAALGALAFGHVALPVTASIVVGGVPGVVVGSLLSSRASDRHLRPVITVAVVAAGLTYVGVPPAGVLWVLTGTLVLASAAWSARRFGLRGGRAAVADVTG